MYMKRILENFVHKRGVEDCKVLAVRDMLQYYGLTMSPFMCSGLGSILFFQYYKFSFGDNNIPLSTVWGRNVKLDENLCSLFKVNKISHKIEDNNERLKIVKSYIDNKYPVYLELDGECLKGNNGGDYKGQRFGTASAAVVFGYDEKGPDTFLYLTNGVYKRYLKIHGNTVMNAQGIPFTLFGPEKSLIIYEAPLETISFTDGIYKAIKIVIENMVGNKELYIGINGMLTFVSDYYKVMDLCEAEANAKYDKYFCILSRSILAGFGIASSSFFRGEYGKFLKEASVLVKDPNLNKCAEMFIKNAAKYRELRKLLVNIQYGKNNTYEIAKAFIDNFKEIVQYEEEALFNLRNSII